MRTTYAKSGTRSSPSHTTHEANDHPKHASIVKGKPEESAHPLQKTGGLGVPCGASESCSPALIKLMTNLFPGIIAVSCGERYSFDDRVDHFSHILMTPSLVLIWSFSDPIHPLVWFLNFLPFFHQTTPMSTKASVHKPAFMGILVTCQLDTWQLMPDSISLFSAQVDVFHTITVSYSDINEPFSLPRALLSARTTHGKTRLNKCQGRRVEKVSLQGTCWGHMAQSALEYEREACDDVDLELWRRR